MLLLVLLLARRQTFADAASKSGRGAMCVAALFLAAAAIYYGWTLKEGVRAGMTGMNYLSIPWVFYEHLGFAGLGPGRTELRGAEVSLFKPYLLPLCLLAVPMGYALWRGMRVRFGLSRRSLVWIGLAVCLPMAFTFTLGFVKQFRVLGRHLTPMLPYVILAQAFALLYLWRGKWMDRAAAILLVLGLLLSSYECRFAFRHSKDDYRAASAVAIEALAAGKKVWWVADLTSAVFYRVPLSLEDVPGRVRMIYTVPPQLTTLPDEVLLSKPDLCDPSGSVRRFLAERHYRATRSFQAFTVWER
jgi:hypothetical protein